MPEVKILLKMPNWVGDCIMATPAIALLRTAFPSAQIDALVRPGVAGVLTDNPHLTNVLDVDTRKANAGFVAGLRAARYDAVVLLTNSLSSAWFAMRLGVPHRVGYARGGRSFLLTRRLPFVRREWQTPTPRPLSRKSIAGPHDAEPRPHHMVEYYLALAEATVAALKGKIAPAAAPHEMVLETTAETETRVESLLEQHGLRSMRLIGLNPGAAYGGAKRWPVERLGAVATQMAGPGVAFISTASPAEADQAGALQGATGARVHRLGELVNLRELAALLKRLDLLITNDSGPMHMAAAVGTPTVAIFGPTDWNVTYPFAQAATVVRKSPPCAPCFLRECPIDHRCMRDILPEEVTKVAVELLTQNAR